MDSDLALVGWTEWRRKQMSRPVTDPNWHGYVLVTPAKNEAATIGETIRSVLAQSVIPSEWAIVSDGSTDRTDEIVSGYATVHPFIHFLRAPSPPARSFGSKIRAFRYGYDRLRTPDYEFIGNLDADITFDANYYLRLMGEMRNNSELGIASGVTYEKVNGQFQRVGSSLNHAVGGTMFFRRQCFEEVGGYQPVSVEGEDAIVERTARMLGWETRSFPELPLYHLRNCGAPSGGKLRRCYRYWPYRISHWKPPSMGDGESHSQRTGAANACRVRVTDVCLRYTVASQGAARCL